MDSATSSSRSQEVNAVAASSSMLSVVIVFFIVVCLFEVNIFVFYYGCKVTNTFCMLQ